MTRFYLVLAIILYAALPWIPCLFETSSPDDRWYPLLIFQVEDYGIELEYIVMNSVVLDVQLSDEKDTQGE